MNLADVSNAFPLIPLYEHFGYRRRPCGNYLIIYRVDDDAVRILRFLHSARNYEVLLFPG